MQKEKTKKGSASLYSVVFAILLFLVIVVAFVALIFSESGKTANDTLAQAARDSALAGVEDAKLALMTYKNCLADSSYRTDCGEIKSIMEITNGDYSTFSSTVDTNTFTSCDVVSFVLGRNKRDGKTYGGEIYIQESTNNRRDVTEQAYTCVKLNDILPNFRATLSENNPYAVVPLDPKDYDLNDIKSISISWASETDLEGLEKSWLNCDVNGDETKSCSFTSADKTPNPAVLSILYLQSNGDSFSASNSIDNSGNRGNLWLVPTVGNDNVTFDGKHPISKDGRNALAYSNDHSDGKENRPYAIKCREDINGLGDIVSGFYCTATIPLPDAPRDKAYLVVSLPYLAPKTSIHVTMNTGDKSCELDSSSDCVNFNRVQTSIDSTGRANDLFTRVEYRVQFTDTNFPFPTNALQAFGDGTGDAVSKDFYVTKNCWYTTSSGEIKQCNV